MDKLEHMIHIAEAPYRKNRHYYQMLDREISSSVREYIKGCTKDTLTVLEKLDIKEFNKSRKVNGMMSTFARGKLQQKMLEELNWHGFDFLEVAPDYTSRAQYVQTSMIRIETVKNLSVHVVVIRMMRIMWAA